MSRREAEDLIQSTEGRLCVRFYRRQDGTVITDNCPVGLKAIKRRVNRFARAAISAILSFGAGFGLSAVLTENEVHNVVGVMAPREALMGDVVNPQIEKPEPLLVDRDFVMGKIRPVQQLPRVNHPPKRTGKR